VAQLAAQGDLPAGTVEPVVHLGELGLDGSVRHVPGVLPMAMAAAEAGVRDVVVPADSVPEAALVPGLRVRGVRSLRELVDLYAALEAGCEVPGCRPAPAGPDEQGAAPDLADVV